ncbi:hypothetical protein [Mycobacterium paraintracellulare]|uniref:hypothetical protein n=1 Tax=Mycobacterium paraintracellulare TaxID=1138383 RepID=UPI001925BA0F|nr:hypothetical protein [Mycobacterium paraintracellulare]BCP14842.1 hypothetical protein MINTM021_17510 [Mycobacterium paraintracellulare]
MAITSGSFSASFDKGLAQGNIESGGGAQNSQTEWNAQITAAVMDPGVPVGNGPQQKG